jgi:hypothetical protein
MGPKARESTMGKDGFGLFIGPRERRGERKPGESIREMKARQAKESRNKKDKKKQDRTVGKAQSSTSAPAVLVEAATRTVAQLSVGEQTVPAVIDRDKGLMRAVKAIDSEVDEHAEALLDIEARLEMLEVVEDATTDQTGANILFASNGLGTMIGFLDGAIKVINAGDTPVNPFANQAAAFVEVASTNMDSNLFGGLGSQGGRLIAMLLRIFAYAQPGNFFGSLFTTDSGGILAGTGTTVAGSGDDPVLT